MKDLAIYGGGGLSREVACLIREINEAAEEPLYRLIGFFDDGKGVGEPVSHFGPVLGGLDVLNAWDKPLCVAIAMGKPKYIKKVAEGCTNPNIEFPNIICPDFLISDPETFTIGRGNVISGGCSVTTNVEIGNFNLLNGSVVMGHDIKIGDLNVFMPDIRVSGEVSIGNCNSFGVKSLILQCLKIGDNVTLGPGAVLLTKPKDGRTYLGNPAKLFKF